MAGSLLQLHCTVVTPEGLEVDANVFDAVLPSHDGRLGILPGHAPLFCQLAPGIMRFHDVTLPRVSTIFIEGGIAHVIEDELTVVSPHVIRRGDMTFAEVEQLLHEVEAMPTRTAAELDVHTAAAHRAKTLLSLVQR